MSLETVLMSLGARVEQELGDVFDGDVVNIHLIALDEKEQQIERPLKHFEFHFVFLRHEARRLRARPCGVQVQVPGEWQKPAQMIRKPN